MPEKKKPFIGYINTANCITLAGLLFALAGCYFALNGELRLSMIVLMLSGICDLFDGLVARKLKKRTEAAKEFGIQLDSLVDVISFGVTPAVIVYSIAGAEWYALAVYSLFIMFAVVRLAYFNTHTVSGVKTACYRGVPVTSIASILPVVLLFYYKSVIPAWSGVVTLGVVALLFIVNVRIPKARGIWYLLFPIMSLVMMAFWWFL